MWRVLSTVEPFYGGMSHLHRWSDQCVDDHDVDRGTKKFMNAGQNLSGGFFDWEPMGFYWETAVVAWFREVNEMPW